MWNKIIDFYSLRVWVDWVVVLAVAIVTSVIPLPGAGQAGEQNSALLAFLGAVVTYTSIVIASTVFACSLIYQSASPNMVLIRTRFSSELRKNWSSVLSWSLLSAAVAVLAMFLNYCGFPALSLVLALNAAVWTSLKGMRGCIWFTTVLFVVEGEDTHPPMSPTIEVNKK